MSELPCFSREEFEVIPAIKKAKFPAELIQIREERQVVVHCRCHWFPGAQLRIWPQNFLVPHGGGKRAKLLYCEGVSMFPVWTHYPAPRDCIRFTMIFEALPTGCEIFDLVELIPEPGAFEVRNIRRNSRDVYEVDMG